MSHATREIEEDVEVVPGSRRRIERLAHALNPALAVGHRPLRFAPAGRGREDHVGQLGGRGEEDVLHDEQVEALEPMPRLGLVGFRLERVLAQDVERPELALLHRLEHFRHVPAARRRDRNAPAPLELRSKLGDFHMLEARQTVGKRPHVASALHVVLAPQRIEARAVAAHMPGQQSQIDQGEHVIDRVVVLGDPQGPADQRPVGPGVGMRQLADRARGHPCFLLGVSERIRLDTPAGTPRSPSWRAR